MNEEIIYIGPRKMPSWSKEQAIAVLAKSIGTTSFRDTDVYHSSLIERTLAVEQKLRSTAPPPTRCRGGQKIHKDRLEELDWPEIALLTARAKALFRRFVGVDDAFVDGMWINVFRQWDSIDPHCHRRARASLVYCIDNGDEDPDCPLSGRFSFVDPRIDACCQFEKGHMTHPLYPDLEPGTMLIFPGYLLHAVSAYAGVRPRITMAWNINERALPGSLKDAFQA